MCLTFAPLGSATSQRTGKVRNVLASSTTSHFGLALIALLFAAGGKVVGLGMNEYELSQNPQLTSFQVKDLNIDPTLPYPDDSFDKVTCVVSVDYLNKPKQIFQDIGRVLRPGGECMLAMSNRWYVTSCCIQVSRSQALHNAHSFVLF